MYKDEKFWDRIASKFDKIEANDIAYKIFIEKARGYLKADDIVLDFGCGTGHICNEIAGNVGFIHAIDISTKMIEIAKNKASVSSILNIDFERTTIFDKKFSEGTFDAIIAFNIFHLLEEQQKYIQRLWQILKPGGLILSATPCMSEAPGLNFILRFFSIIGLTPKINSYTSNEMEQLFLKASFKTIEMNRIKPNSPQYLCISQKHGINNN
ncbi:MAG: class I SAM-dependent methyltransferase [Bacteroidales bacterium]|nr:class I SAM-dependent methyltransferase [Bacteroidales bacterium]